MDAALIILCGGSFVGFLAMLATLAAASGFIFQGALIGFLALAFGSVLLAMLCDA